MFFHWLKSKSDHLNCLNGLITSQKSIHVDLLLQKSRFGPQSVHCLFIIRVSIRIPFSITKWFGPQSGYRQLQIPPPFKIGHFKHVIAVLVGKPGAETYQLSGVEFASSSLIREMHDANDLTSLVTLLAQY